MRYLHSEGYTVISMAELERQLAPLPIDAIVRHAAPIGRLLVVDECRTSSGVAGSVMSAVTERTDGTVQVRRVTAPDSYIPLGDAANLVLVTEPDIEAAIRAMVAT